MILIYSNKLENLKGDYINPPLFKKYGIEKGVSKVYSDDEQILKAYEDAGVLTERITKDLEDEKPKRKRKRSKKTLVLKSS